MKLMSDYVTKLEGFPDLEVSIIRATKINKVLKAILKLDNIPKEDEFKFKPRSQVLLDKWNKLLSADGAPAAAAGEVNGTSKPASKANGLKEKTEVVERTKAKEDSKEDLKEEAKKEAQEMAKEDPKELPKGEASEAAEKPAAEEVSLPITEHCLLERTV